MLTSTSNQTRESWFAVFCLLGIAVLGCKMASLPGGKVNLFEGTTAADGAAKIAQKLGVADPRVKYIEIHEDRMEITVQDPAKPKNFDAYTYEKGVVTGPRPVEALVLGNQEFTADKSKLFNLSEVNLAAIPETCRKAAERAQVEDGKPELIPIDWQVASMRLTKAEKEKKRQDEGDEFLRRSRSGNMGDPLASFTKARELAVTWRIYIKGPHMTKDLWADEKGNLFEPSW